MQNNLIGHLNANINNKLASQKQNNTQSENDEKQSNTHKYPDITNQIQYIDYVKQILNNKQNQLIQFQNTLNIKQKQLYQVQFTKNMGKFISSMYQIKSIQSKLKYILNKIGINNQQDLQLCKNIQVNVNKYVLQVQTVLKKQYMELINQRKLIQIKLSQFSQLQVYQKYLNQLHQALQHKNQQLSQRQYQLSIKNNQLINYHHVKKNTNLSPSSSHRKRVKYAISSFRIFGNRNTNISEQHQNCHRITNNQNQILVKHRRQQINLFHQPNSIIEEQSKHQYSSNPISSQEQQKQQKQQLEDMEQLSLSQQQQQDHQSQQQKQQQQSYAQQQQSQQEQQDISFHNTNICKNQLISQNSNLVNQHKSVERVNYSVQVDQQSIEQTDVRLRKQALIIKYAAKWIKSIIYSQKCGAYKKKAAAVDLWRLTTVFDETISHKIKQKLTIFQNMWKKKQKLLYQSKMFPYNQLSLRRKKYTQLMFDYEQKIFYTNKIKYKLKQILKNKHRKQRLTFYYYFCKLIKNVSNNNHSSSCRSIKKKYSVGQTRQTTRQQSKSQLIQVYNNNLIKNQDKIIQPLNKSILNIVNHHKSHSTHFKNLHQNNHKQPLPYQQHIPKKTKQNAKNDNKHNNYDNKHNHYETITKLNIILDQKQKALKLLATQCVKLQGLIKMIMVIVLCSYRTYHYAIKQILQINQNNKINDLNIQVNGMEAKLNVLMNKCKLGITSNSNKIAIIENLLDFNKSKK